MTRRPGDDFSSPACSMCEVSDAYMGYADRRELIDLLEELLAAGGHRRMLRRHLARMGGTRAPAAFGPCDPDRIVLRLRQMLPRIRDDALHADLSRMLQACEAPTSSSA
ncbi:MAG TPA: hypothetical protein VM689_24190 [Aliidongia sp.]|nr:hypothetical protein [Aliidongia sp.]